MIQKGKFLRNIGFATCLGMAAGTLQGCQVNKPVSPNIVFFLIDDLGYTDLGCYGSNFYETPNIDKLAEKATVFTNAYAACAVCSPTRASILTGKYPARLRLTNWIGPEVWQVGGKMQTPGYLQQLPLEEFTIAEALKTAGYSTCYIGKWHLGKRDYYPDKQGFDLNIAGNDTGGPTSYFSPYVSDNYSANGWDGEMPNLPPGPKGEYLTDRLTDEAINYLDTVKGKPFFLYFSHYAVHAPMRAKEELIRKYREKAAFKQNNDSAVFIRDINGSYTRTVQNHDVYAAMVHSMDESIGRVLRKLDEMGVAENTVVIFTSDNGGWANSNFQKGGFKFNPLGIPTSVLPLRTGKGWYYEGGIKVPTMIYWPGAKTNGTHSNVAITSTDYYPTLLEICNLPLLPEQHKDGQSLVPLLKGQLELVTREAIYWHFPHYHGNGEKPCSAIRKGKYKLIQRYEDQTIELYNLEEDIGEKNDLKLALPKVASGLLEDLSKWKASVNAEMPIMPGE